MMYYAFFLKYSFQIVLLFGTLPEDPVGEYIFEGVGMTAFLIGALVGFVLLSAWKFWSLPAEEG